MTEEQRDEEISEFTTTISHEIYEFAKTHDEILCMLIAIIYGLASDTDSLRRIDDALMRLKMNDDAKCVASDEGVVH